MDKLNQGIAPIVIILIIAGLVALTGGSLWYYQKERNKAEQNIEQSVNSQVKIQEQAIQIASSSVDTSTWKTYRNEKYGFEFRYPKQIVLRDDLKYGYTNKLYKAGEPMPVAVGEEKETSSYDLNFAETSLITVTYFPKPQPLDFEKFKKDLAQRPTIPNEEINTEIRNIGSDIPIGAHRGFLIRAGIKSSYFSYVEYNYYIENGDYIIEVSYARAYDDDNITMDDVKNIDAKKLAIEDPYLITDYDNVVQLDKIAKQILSTFKFVETIKLISPDLTKGLGVDNSYEIKWELSDDLKQRGVASVSLDYQRRGEATNNSIAVLDGSASSYKWTVPYSPGPGYYYFRITITTKDRQSVYYYSDVFQIYCTACAEEGP